MKLVTEQEIKEFEAATWNGGVKGFAIGLGASLAGSFLLQKRSLRYRALPLPAKAFGIILVTAPACVIVAERAGIKYDRVRYSGEDQERELTPAEYAEKKRWEGMSASDKALNWADRNKWSLIATSWLGTMGGAWAYISRDPYMTFSQKIVQVRMWAQGVTLGAILASALLSNAERKKNRDKKADNSHSWEAALEEHQKHHNHPEQVNSAVAHAKTL